MSDLISRQEAIEAIRKDVMGGMNYESILKRLPSVEPRWIPVEEKLPEVGESVLVTFSLIEKYSWVKIARYGTPIYEDKICFFENDSEWGDYEISGVTAWMPLPKPYERRTDATD